MRNRSANLLTHWLGRPRRGTRGRSAEKRPQRLDIQHLEDRTMPDGATPQVVLMHLRNDTGPSPTDGITSDPSVRGLVTNDDGLQGVGIEIDLTGDGEADGTTITAEDGSFEYVPAALQPGATTFWARAWEWDDVTQDHLFGAWLPFTFTFQPDPNQPSTVTTLGLVRDTGASATDGVTIDPGVTGLVSNPDGGVQGLTVELDRNADGVADAEAPTDGDGRFVATPDGAQLGPMTVRARARERLHPYTATEFVYGPWASVSFTLAPVPTAQVTSLRLLNDTGASATDGVTTDATLTGEISAGGGSPNGLFVGFDLTGDGEADLQTTADSMGQFTLVPGGLTPGPVTAKARYQEWDAANGKLVTSPWVSINFTLLGPAAPTVAELKLLNDDGPSNTDKITTDPTVAGALASPEGVAAKDVEIDLDDDGTVDERLLSDADGKFTFPPTGVTPGSVTIKARGRIFDPVTQEYITSPWTTLTFTLLSNEPVPGIVSELKLANDDGPSGTDNVTSDPTLTGKVVNAQGLPVSQLVEIDTDGDGVPDGFVPADEQGVFAFFPDGAAPGPLTVRARTRVQGDDPDQTATGSWASVSFTLVGATNAPPSVSGLKLANDDGPSGTDNVTSDPTLTGQIVNPDGATAYQQVQYDADGDEISDGLAVADHAGVFAVTPKNLRPGSVTIKVRPVEYDVRSGGPVPGAWQAITFSLVPGTDAPAPDPADVTQAADNAAGRAFVRQNAAVGSATGAAEADLVIGAYTYTPWAGGLTPQAGTPFTPYAVAEMPAGRTVTETSFSDTQVVPTANGSYTITQTGTYYYALVVTGTAYTIDSRVYFTYVYDGTTTVGTTSTSLHQTGTYLFSLSGSGTYTTSATGTSLSGQFTTRESTYFSYDYNSRNNYTLTDPGSSGSGTESIRDWGDSRYDYSDTGTFSSGGPGDPQVSSSFTLSATMSGTYTQSLSGTFSYTDPLSSIGGTASVTTNSSYSAGYTDRGQLTKSPAGNRIDNGSLSYDSNNTSGLSHKYTGTFRSTEPGYSESGGYSLGGAADTALSRYSVGGSYTETADGTTFTGGFGVSSSAGYTVGRSASGDYSRGYGVGSSSTGTFSSGLSASAVATTNDNGPYSQSTTGGGLQFSLTDNFNYTASAGASASHKVTTDARWNVLGVSVGLNYSITNTSTDKKQASVGGTYTADTSSTRANGYQSFSEQSTLDKEWIGGGSVNVNTGAVSIGGQVGVSRTNNSSNSYRQTGNYSIAPGGAYTLTGGQYDRTETARANYSLSYGGGLSVSLLGSGVSGGFQTTQTGNSASSYSEVASNLTITDTTTTASGTFGFEDKRYDSVTYSLGGGYRLSGFGGYNQGTFQSNETGHTSASLTKSGSFSRSDASVTHMNGPVSNFTSKSSNTTFSSSGNFSWGGGAHTGNTSYNRATTFEASHSDGGTLDKTPTGESVTGGTFGRKELATAAVTESESGRSTTAATTRNYSSSVRQDSSTALTDSGTFSRVNGTLTSGGTETQTVSASGSYGRSLTATFDINALGQSAYYSATNLGTGSRSATDVYTSNYDRGNTTGNVRGSVTMNQKVLNDQTVTSKVTNSLGGLGNTRSSSYTEREVTQTSAGLSGSQGYSITAGFSGGGAGPHLGEYSSTGRSESGTSTTQTATSASSSYTGTITYAVTLPGYTNRDTSSRTERSSSDRTASRTTNYTQGFGATAQTTNGTFKSDVTTTMSADFSVTHTHSWSWLLSGGRSWGNSTMTGFEKSNGTQNETNGAFRSDPAGSSESAQSTATTITEYREGTTGSSGTETRNGNATSKQTTGGSNSRYTSTSLKDSATYTQSTYADIPSGRNGTIGRKEYGNRSHNYKTTTNVTNGPAPFEELSWGSYAIHAVEMPPAMIDGGSGPTISSKANRTATSSASESSDYQETFSYRRAGASAPGSPPPGGGGPPGGSGSHGGGGGPPAGGVAGAESASGTFTYNTSFAEKFTADDDSSQGFNYGTSSPAGGNGTSGYSKRLYDGHRSEGWTNTSNENGSFHTPGAGQSTTITGTVTSSRKVNGYSASYKVNENHDYTYHTSTTDGYTSTTRHSGSSGAKGTATTNTDDSESGGYTLVRGASGGSPQADMDWTSGSGKAQITRNLQSDSNRSLRYNHTWSSTAPAPTPGPDDPSGTNRESTTLTGGGSGYTNSTDIASTSYSYYYDKTDTISSKSSGGRYSLTFKAVEKQVNKSQANGWGESQTRDGSGANVTFRSWTRNTRFSSSFVYNTNGSIVDGNVQGTPQWKKTEGKEEYLSIRETVRHGTGDPVTTSNYHSTSWVRNSSNSNPTGATPGWLDWAHLALDVVSIFDPTGLTAIASIGLSIYKGEDVTMLAVLGAVPLVGKAAKAVSVGTKIAGRVEKATKVIEAGTKIGMGGYAVVTGGSQVVKGVQQMADGHAEMGAFNALRGAASIAGGIKGVASGVKTFRSMNQPQLGNPNCGQRGGACFVAGTPVVVGEEVDEAAVAEFLRLLAEGELLLERGYLSAAANELLNRAETLEEILGITEWERRAMGVMFLAVGFGLGGWYGLRLRRRKPAGEADPAEPDPFAPLDVEQDDELNQILERVRGRRYDCLVPLDV